MQAPDSGSDLWPHAYCTDLDCSLDVAAVMLAVSHAMLVLRRKGCRTSCDPSAKRTGSRKYRPQRQLREAAVDVIACMPQYARKYRALDLDAHRLNARH